MHLRVFSITRLSLSLNFANFYQSLHLPHHVIELQKRTFDDALNELDQIPEEDYKEVAFMLQLLRDSCTLYTSEPIMDDKENSVRSENEAYKLEEEKIEQVKKQSNNQEEVVQVFALRPIRRQFCDLIIQTIT